MMGKTLQLKGGDTAKNDAYTGAVREVTVDTEKKTLRVHDGETEGGFELPSGEVFEGVAMKAEANTFTASQRGSIVSLDNDTLAWDFRVQNNMAVTLTADGDVSIATDGLAGCIGQGGMITVNGAEHITGWGSEFKWKNVPDDLDGTERFGYFVEAEDSIAIGVVK